MAGVTIDVCLAFAAMQAVEAGYNAYGVVDASGALEVTIRENAVANERSWDHTHQLDYGCGRAAAELEPADREGLGAGLPRPLSQLRPFDGQFRVQDRKCAPEGVLATSPTVPDDRLRPISLSGCRHEVALAPCRLTRRSWRISGSDRGHAGLPGEKCRASRGRHRHSS